VLILRRASLASSYPRYTTFYSRRAVADDDEQLLMRNVQASSSSSRPRKARTQQQSFASPPALEFSIHHDELEAHRIALENNLNQTDLSLHLSSAASAASDAEHDYEPPSVEYPRHASHPSPLGGFRSFDASHVHDGPAGWSYRTHDDEDIPYDGQSISTAHHHASAVTLNAGLGGRASRRHHTADISLSGAEYDPERPLTAMIAGMGSRLSALDASSRKYPVRRPRLTRL
jgi:hypothetical protein